MTLWDFVQLTDQIAYARLLATVGPWWPLGVAIGAVVLIVVGYRKSSVRIPWGQIGSIVVMVLIGALAAAWMIFGVIALAPVAFLVALIAGLIAAFARLFKWLSGRKQQEGAPGPWLRDRMSGVLTADEKRALLAWAEKHPYGEYLPEEQESEEA